MSNLSKVRLAIWIVFAVAVWFLVASSCGCSATKMLKPRPECKASAECECGPCPDRSLIDDEDAEVVE